MTPPTIQRFFLISFRTLSRLGSPNKEQSEKWLEMTDSFVNRPGTMIQQVDDNDFPIGGIPREDALRFGANFRVVHILVMNRHGEVLLQQIPSHARHPNQWGSSVAGYVEVHESYEEAAVRKLGMELGIHAQPSHLGKTSMTDGSSKKFIGVYMLHWDDPISPNPSDYGALCFVPVDGIDAWIRAQSAHVTPTSLHVLRFVRSVHPHLDVDSQL